jgi:hypothetical protein
MSSAGSKGAGSGDAAAKRMSTVLSKFMLGDVDFSGMKGDQDSDDDDDAEPGSAGAAEAGGDGVSCLPTFGAGGNGRASRASGGGGGGGGSSRRRASVIPSFKSSSDDRRSSVAGHLKSEEATRQTEKKGHFNEMIAQLRAESAAVGLTDGDADDDVVAPFGSPAPAGKCNHAHFCQSRSFLSITLLSVYHAPFCL